MRTKVGGYRPLQSLRYATSVPRKICVAILTSSKKCASHCGNDALQCARMSYARGGPRWLSADSQVGMQLAVDTLSLYASLIPCHFGMPAQDLRMQPLCQLKMPFKTRAITHCVIFRLQNRGQVVSTRFPPGLFGTGLANLSHRKTQF